MFKRFGGMKPRLSAASFWVYAGKRKLVYFFRLAPTRNRVLAEGRAARPAVDHEEEGIHPRRRA